ncbi:hypothetical protein SPAB_01892 [Salmonella enterica subsp. enterica serovar Paratyphi B str. SPB7]|uniref:Uncharacterized protein n=1 Tax=Salmonella paratyphi B (strain ATCC BAA-1250 / SPB7) TaxID=1016998 RepID=A0A6C6Z1T9_SALPB|nr:hypothetical protein SPAB_01892 [Salmonella enterica subsp. enterica serovar Paratyphi B str. SPB7]
MCKNALSFFREIEKGESPMTKDRKFSLITTLTFWA